MAASTIPISAEENLGDPIDIQVDVIHPEPVAAVAFPAAAIVRTQAQHGEAIRGIQEHLLGVPIQEELTALRFRADIAEAEHASFRARIKTTKAIEKITRNRERQARVKIEQQLAAEGLCHAESRTEGQSKEKQLEEVPIVQDFPEVFPEDLSDESDKLEDKQEACMTPQLILRWLKKEQMQRQAFQLIKQKLSSGTNSYRIPEGNEDFIAILDATIKVRRSSVRSKDLEALSVRDKIYSVH
ncbi:hypothetical protein Tco_0664072 [Tanacetum coccineum]